MASNAGKNIKIYDEYPHVVAAHLAWMDAVERLDTLILEIRHLQTNIIHYLKEPILLEALVYEEIYLYGAYMREIKDGANQGSWFEIFNEFKDPTNFTPFLRKLASAWVIQYPSFGIIHGKTHKFTLGKTYIYANEQDIFSTEWNDNGEYLKDVGAYFDRRYRGKKRAAMQDRIAAGGGAVDFGHDGRRHYHSLCSPSISLSRP